MPTLGPLLELGIVQPLNAAKRAREGKQTHFLADELRDLKSFIPAENVWYAKAALDHMIWQQVMESLSPGYLQAIRSKTLKTTGQQWWWAPGDITPERTPDLNRAIEK